MRRDLSLVRVVLIYLFGIAAGVQAALYVYDTWDDGVSEPLSGMIAVAFLIVGAGLIAHSFRQSRTD